MENENDSFGNSFDDSSEPADAKSVYLLRLHREIEDHDIPPDALEDWLDVKFRNEAIVDSNIVWGRAIRSFTEHLTVAELAAGLEHSQWRELSIDGIRFMVRITSIPEEPAQDSVELSAYNKLQGYFALDGLFEESDLKLRLQNRFYNGLVQLQYEYFVHQDDLGRLPDLPDLEDAVVFGKGNVYIPTSGNTIGIRPFNPDITVSEYRVGMPTNEFIAEIQTNTLYNEYLWDGIETVTPSNKPLPYRAAIIA